MELMGKLSFLKFRLGSSCILRSLALRCFGRSPSLSGQGEGSVEVELMWFFGHGG